MRPRWWPWQGARAELDGLRDAFEETGNPILAWRGLWLARRYRTDIPDWVLRYLDGCAAALALESVSDVRELEKEGPGQIGRRLGFTRGYRTSYEDAYQLSKSRAGELMELMEEACMTASRAAVEAQGIERATVYRHLSSDNAAYLIAIRVDRAWPSAREHFESGRLDLLSVYSELCSIGVFRGGRARRISEEEEAGILARYLSQDTPPVN